MSWDQPEIPGAQKLMYVDARAAGADVQNYAAYLSISVQQRQDGSWRVHKLTLDSATGRILVERLDGGEDMGQVSLTRTEVLLYWAQQLVLDDRGVVR